MADILIRGMEMPKENEILVFDVWHGKMYARSTANTGARRYEVVSFPEGHGDLIDRDAIDRAFTDLRFNSDGTLNHWGDRPGWCMHGYEVEKLIADAPTIVPAEGGQADGNRERSIPGGADD